MQFVLDDLTPVYNLRLLWKVLKKELSIQKEQLILKKILILGGRERNQALILVLQVKIGNILST